MNTSIKSIIRKSSLCLAAFLVCFSVFSVFSTPASAITNPNAVIRGDQNETDDSDDSDGSGGSGGSGNTDDSDGTGDSGDSSSSSTTDDNCVDTAILGENGQSCDDGDGGSIVELLNLVVDIMSIGVGILGVTGISIVGVQYLTAGGNEEKTRKAKRRMFEIVLGIVAYVILYAALKFLLPGFGGTSGST